MTIFAMHDSLIERNIEPLKTDSIFRDPLWADESDRQPSLADTAIGNITIRKSTAFVEVYVSPENKDSVRRILRPLVAGMGNGKFHRRFIIHLGADSLSKENIARDFRKALSASGISVSFRVHRIQSDIPGRRGSVGFAGESMVSDLVPFNQFNHYAVSFESTNRFFLKAITPQIFFSIFVTLITAASFYLMQRSIRTQNKVMKLKNDFISNVSHELKTPVATVSVALEAMEKFKALEDSQKTKEYLDMARNELNRLILMTDKILKTASFENRDPEMKTERMNLDLQVNDVLQSMRLLFEKRQLQVRYERKGNDFFVSGSPAHLQTVLYNLLDNAVKYSPGSSAVTVMLEDRGDEIMLSVADNGIGIPPAYHKKVFEKFFRVPSGDVHDTKGYGLGLSYVAHVVESHKGDIKVESESGKGSCFKIRLPKIASAYENKGLLH